jgi:hypothetical protein
MSANYSSGISFESQGDPDLKVWGRIGTSANIPPAISTPVLTPNVRIANVDMPDNVRIKSQFYYNESSFSFIVVNDESFEFPVYWKLETNTAPGTTINALTYPTSGVEYIPCNGKTEINVTYWFSAPGNYVWRYVLTDASGNIIDSWSTTLVINP